MSTLKFARKCGTTNPSRKSRRAGVVYTTRVCLSSLNKSTDANATPAARTRTAIVNPLGRIMGPHLDPLRLGTVLDHHVDVLAPADVRNVNVDPRTPIELD